MNTQLKSAQTTVEWTSKITLWVLIGISLVILVLFLLIGYDRPYEENPSFNDPQLTDVLIIWTYILIVATTLTTIIAVIGGLINGSGKSLHAEKGLASKANLIAWGTFIVSVIIGLVVGIKNKNEFLLINGKNENDATDIILTDTSMIAILILTIVTVLVTVYSMIAKAINK